MLSQKHQSASKVTYNSGFFITTNELPDFVHKRDNGAIKCRLKIYNTKALPKRDTSVTSK